MIKAVIAWINKFQYEKHAIFIALAVLFVISAILSPYFTRIQNLLNILRQVSYVGIIALGMTFVIISGGIDLSVGSLIAFIGAVGILTLNYLMAVFNNEYLAISGAILAALIMGILSGALNGFLITRGRIAPFIVTLGSMAIFRYQVFNVISLLSYVFSINIQELNGFVFGLPVSHTLLSPVNSARHIPGGRCRHGVTYFQRLFDCCNC